MHLENYPAATFLGFNSNPLYIHKTPRIKTALRKIYKTWLYMRAKQGIREPEFGQNVR